MVLIQSGDSDAFETLYERYKQRLLYFFYRMLNGDVELTQDFLQETFLRMIDSLATFQPGRRFSPWIYTIAHNLCKNEYRRLGVRSIMERSEKMEELTRDTRAGDNSVDEKIDSANFKKALEKELRKLEVKKGCTFVLRYYENCSIKEIAEIMSCSEGTVKSRLFYAAKKIATQLKEFDPSNREYL